MSRSQRYNDHFIKPHHARELHSAYAGDKVGSALVGETLLRAPCQNFIMVEGDHNSARSKFFMDSVSIFFFNTLQVRIAACQYGCGPTVETWQCDALAVDVQSEAAGCQGPETVKFLS